MIPSPYVEETTIASENKEYWRWRFAGQAMAAMVSDRDGVANIMEDFKMSASDALSKGSIAMADALIAELVKEQK